jgi:hypothetical protein
MGLLEFLYPVEAEQAAAWVRANRDAEQVKAAAKKELEEAKQKMKMARDLETLVIQRERKTMADLAAFNKWASNERARIDSEKTQLEQTHRNQKGALDRQRAELQVWQDALDSIRKELGNGNPTLAARYADFAKLRVEIGYPINALVAPRAAILVKEAAGRARDAEFRAKVAEYKLRYIESLYCISPEDIESAEDEILPDDTTVEELSDPCEKHLSGVDYVSLPQHQREHLALMNWQRAAGKAWAGLEYELSVGQELERAGWRVEYVGLMRGKEDRGIDLVAERNDGSLIIQCKRWNQSRIVRENHVFQLVGSLRNWMQQSNHDGPFARAALITTSTLSDFARDAARRLDVQVRENHPINNPALIKCNISTATGEPIYHLPFDQQYRTTKIDRSRGEMWAHTPEEAQHAGFRRAWRWAGRSDSSGE